MNIEEIQTLFSKIQENEKIFSIKFNNWPIWVLVKNRLFEALLNHYIEKRKETLYSNIRKKFFAILYQLWNIPKAYFQWWSYKRKKRQISDNPTIILLIDGFFRNIKEESSYSYPFGEDLIESEKRKFNIFSIERNHRTKKNRNPKYYPNICEDFISFTVPIKNRFVKNIELEICKKLLYTILQNILYSYPEILQIFRSELDSSLTNQLLLSFSLSKRKAIKLLQEIKPFALLCTAPVGILWWIAAAKELGIKVLEYQHGIIDKYQPQYNWPSYLSTSKSKLLTPDYIFMWGDYWIKENMLLGFWMRTELISCGFSKIENYRDKYKYLIRSSFKNINNNMVKYLYSTAKPIRNQSIEFLDCFLNIAKINNLKVKVIVKLHPFEDSEYKYYYKLKEKYPTLCDVYYHHEKNIYDLFVECMVHLSVFSASIIESIELGRPTVILNLPGKEYFQSLIDENIVAYADSPEDLFKIYLNIVRNLSYWNKWIEQTNAKQGYFIASNSKKRCTEFINSLIDKN